MDKTFVGCAPGNFQQGRPLDLLPEAIVIHIGEGSLRSIDSQFHDPKAKVSAHYCVAKSGDIHQYVEETDTAFHAGIVVNPSWPLLKQDVNPNFYTIGIEHEGHADDVWPEIQIKTSVALVAEIARRWHIPLDTLHVIRHHQIRASKTCPGSFMKDTQMLLDRIAPAVNNPPPAITVRTITALNLRAGAPSATALVRRVIPANTTLNANGVFTGDAVSGNNKWYSDGAGNFFWSGGTDHPNP